MEQGRSHFNEEMRKEREKSAEASRKHDLEIKNGSYEAETLRRRVSEVATERDIISDDRASKYDALSRRLAEETARCKKLSETLLTTERVGARLRDESRENKSESEELRRKSELAEQNLEATRGHLVKSQEVILTIPLPHYLRRRLTPPQTQTLTQTLTPPPKHPD